MKPWMAGVVAGVLGLAGIGFGEADEPDPAGDGWVALFDGETLAGWHSWRTREPLEAGAWQAEDGELVLTGKGGGDIYTARAYRNFELTVEWKAAGNSGILLRVDPTYRGAIWHRGPELQINRDDPEARGSTSSGGVYGLYGFDEPKVYFPEGWNRVSVRCRDGHYTIWFNGRQTAAFEVGSADWNRRVAESKFSKHPGFGTLPEGHIGLQDHGSPVRFRQLRIRAL